ncbi:copper resistance CopC family protein [Frondihabitans peucedani]|uniref:CopC domain-containing protein n=1 Tax=Frondihabitans peucedani TaxID=598626 RepID=A0ABP8E5B3_9MICO
MRGSRTRVGLARRALAAAGLVVAAGALALLPAAGASAHDYLVSSNPKADSTQSTALSKVVLTFDDRVLDLSGDGSSNVVEVTGPAGKHFETGCPTIADTDVSVPVDLGDSGRYTVRWQIVSADGHTVSSSIVFRYDRPSSATAASGADARPACGDQASSGSSAGDGSSATGSGDSEAGSSSSSGLGVALGVGGGIIAVAVVAVVIVLVRNRPAPPAA